MLNHLNGATGLFPIIGDPINYVESPQRLTRTLRTVQQPGWSSNTQTGLQDETAFRVNVRWVTSLGEETASTS
jgi:hypothetical protein